VLYCFSYDSSLFPSGYFGGRVSLFAQASLDCDSLILSFPPSLGVTDVYHHTQLFPSRWGFANFFFALIGLEL
jgi:hypothetical protein